MYIHTHTYIISRIDDANMHIIENNLNEYVSKLEIYIIYIFPCIFPHTFFMEAHEESFTEWHLSKSFYTLDHFQNSS